MLDETTAHEPTQHPLDHGTQGPMRDRRVSTIPTYDVHGEQASQAREIDESTKEQLRSLGYIQ
jgi:hypothetical protein